MRLNKMTVNNKVIEGLIVAGWEECSGHHDWVFSFDTDDYNYFECCLCGPRSLSEKEEDASDEHVNTDWLFAAGSVIH